jgi:hypothetical protein
MRAERRFGAADEFAGCMSHGAQIVRFLAGPDPGEGDTEPTPSATHDAVRTASIGRRRGPANDFRWVVPADRLAMANSRP